MGKKHHHNQRDQAAPKRKMPERKGSPLGSVLTVLVPCLMVLAVGGYLLFGASPLGMAGRPEMTPTTGSGSSGSSSRSTGGSSTAQNVSLPAYVRGPTMTQAYQFAVERPDVLDYVPCWCGCGKHSNHQSNRSCFVKTGQTNGKVVFDDHGANCDMCIDLAIDAKRLTAEGKSAREVRQYVEEKYGGKGEATNTPWPQA